MSKLTRVSCVVVGLMVVFGVSSASAQVFGTFSWQMQPFCNKVTLTLTNLTGNFTLDGSEDQCGAATKASAAGIGVFNPNGTVGLNFTIVTSPSGRAAHVSAIVSPANGQGTWSDSSGNSGTFAFFGAVPGLPARPLPSASGAITQRSATSGTIAAGGNGSATATCLAGERVISGGNDGFFDVFVVASRRDGNGWAVFAHNNSAGNRSIQAHVYCLAP